MKVTSSFKVRDQGGTDTNVLNERSRKIDKGIGGLDRVRTANLVSFFSDITCGEGCWSAKEDVCRCECGGKNHGIHLRGETAIRACRINGYRYELVSVGKHGDLMNEGSRLTAESWLEAGAINKAYGERPDRPYTREDLFWNDDGVEKPAGWIGFHHLKGGGSKYAVKYATLSQCLKWKELEYFGVADERDRYQANAAILWRRADLER